MRLLTTTILASALLAVAALPAFADSMAKGEGMMIMSDGTMSTMMSMDAKSQAAMMKMSKPMKSCVVMMMGDDGKMYTMTESDKKCTAQGKM